MCRMQVGHAVQNSGAPVLSACNIRQAHMFYTNLQLYPDAVLLLTGASIYMGN